MRRFIVLTLLAFTVLCGTALAAGNIPEIHEEPMADLDARTVDVAPSEAQQQAVRALGAKATWTDFGAPATLINHDGFLGPNLAGARPADAARTWLEANKSLFKLSTLDSLKLEKATRLAGAGAYAVLYRQQFGGLEATEDGYVTVGVYGDPGAWKVGFVSGSLVQAASVATPTLSAAAAWIAAAAAVGESFSVAQIGETTDDREWKVFPVQGTAGVQRARLRALPTEQGIRPVWEALLVDQENGHSKGYSSLVDAVTGEVLVRHNLVDQAAPVAEAFSGSVPPVDAACDVDKGPWTVDATENSPRSTPRWSRRPRTTPSCN